MIRSKKLTLLNLKHGFFNSIGGHSKNIYKSLNCGPGSLDNKSNIKKNLKIVKKKISNNSISFRFFFIFKLFINKYKFIAMKLMD